MHCRHGFVTESERHGENWESMRDGVRGEGGWPHTLRVCELAASYAQSAARIG